MATSVSTIAGNFDSMRAKSLRKTLEDAKAEGMSRDQVVMFDGQELLISFGEYLLEHVEMELAQRGTRGL